MLGVFTNTGDGCRGVAKVTRTSGFCDAHGGVSEVACTETGNGSAGGVNDIGDGIAIASAGFSTSSSGVVASASASPIVRVITEGDACALGPISTSPPCSMRLCIAELCCDPVGDQAPLSLALLDPCLVLALGGSTSMMR